MKSRVVVERDKALDDCHGAHHHAVHPFPEILIKGGGFDWHGKEQAHLPVYLSNTRGEMRLKSDTQARIEVNCKTQEVHSWVHPSHPHLLRLASHGSSRVRWAKRSGSVATVAWKAMTFPIIDKWSWMWVQERPLAYVHQSKEEGGGDCGQT